MRKAAGAFRRLRTPLLEDLPHSPDIFREYRWLVNCPDVRRMDGGWLYRGGFYPDYLTVGGASHAIFRVALEHCGGAGVDIGAGYWPLPGSTPVDLARGGGLGRTIQDFADESLDFVFSSHCLEHIVDWRGELAAWVHKLRRSGTLFLYLPHPDCAIWQPGAPFVGDGHKWSPTPSVIKSALADLGCELIDFDDGPDAMYSFYVCARRT